MTRMLVSLMVLAIVMFGAAPAGSQTADTLESRVARLEERLRGALAEVADMSREIEALKSARTRTAPAAAVQQASLSDDAPPPFESLVVSGTRQAIEASRAIAAKPDIF